MYYIPVVDYVSHFLQAGLWLWDGTEICTLCHVSGQETTVADLMVAHRDFVKYLIEQSGSSCPRFTFVNQHTCMVHFRSDEGVFILGPLSFLFTDISTEAIHTYDGKSLPAGLTQSLPSVPPPQAIRCVLLLFNTVNGTSVTENECYQQNFKMEHFEQAVMEQTTSDMFVNRENLKKHTPYEQEERIQRCIESGDAASLPLIWKEPVQGSLGTLARDPVRNGRNLAQANVTLCSRSAIRGGAAPEDVLTLCDSYIQQIEEMKNLMLLQPLVEGAELTFATMVAQARQKEKKAGGDESPLVTESKDYISLHLHERLTVQDVAAAVNVHPNYLSSLFQKTEGISMYQYILHQKVSLAKNLLRYSNSTFLEIANDLGFASQSHLGRVFKEQTGMTLKEYRIKNKPRG